MNKVKDDKNAKSMKFKVYNVRVMQVWKKKKRNTCQTFIRKMFSQRNSVCYLWLLRELILLLKMFYVISNKQLTKVFLLFVFCEWWTFKTNSNKIKELLKQQWIVEWKFGVHGVNRLVFGQCF